MASNILPVVLTSFIGREKEIAELTQLLAQTRLLTLTGAGGAGKTRLALEVASLLADSFEHGVWWVELAALNDAALVPQAVAKTLDVRESSGQSLVQILVNYLRSKQLLLVLDNCEHLIAGCAELTDTLLFECPNLKILVTSRERMGSARETFRLVPSLAFPDPRHLPPLDTLPQYEAVRLFMDRAVTVKSDLALTTKNSSFIAQICYRLDGIPLAIELAAARVRMLTLAQIAERLDDSMRLLTRGSPYTLPRHQTLRATIDWSYGLLPEKERMLFRRLSVFVGGFTLDAAEAICSGEGIVISEILDLLSSLEVKSLLVVQELEDTRLVRYRLLETIRQYATEKCLEADEAEILRMRHLEWFLGLAERGDKEVRGPDQVAWLDRLEAELDNFRAALEWSQRPEDNRQIGPGLRLTADLAWFWRLHDHFIEGRRWLETMLARSGEPTVVRVKALVGAGLLAFIVDDYTSATAFLEEALTLSHDLKDEWGIAWSLHGLGRVAYVRGQDKQAQTFFEQSLPAFRTSGDEAGSGYSLYWLGRVARFQSNLEQAATLCEQAVVLLRKVGDIWGLAWALNFEARVLLDRHQSERAATLFKESLLLCADLQTKWGITSCLKGLADSAAALQQTLSNLAPDYALEYSTRLNGAVEALNQSMSVTDWIPSERAAFKRDIDALRVGLGDEKFSATWAEGRGLTMEQAIQRALVIPSWFEKDSLSPKTQTDVPQLGELRILALGTPQVYRRDRLLTSADWVYTKSQELLFFLLSNSPVTKEQVGLAFWPDASPEQLRNNLKVHLHYLRRALGRREWIIFENDHYAFNRTLDYWFDVQVFESNLAQARRLQTSNPAQAIQFFEEAIKLYRGEFMGDLDGNWWLARRENLQREYIDALLTLGQLHFAENRYAMAAEVYRQVITHDTYSEAAHRELMRCYARQGEQARALRQYQMLIDLLRDDLDGEPAPETTALYERLRQGNKV